ncbi:MAG: flippase-like domain-containing protein [Ruminococcaceae bacterium]|nr:flippase-like domain-containing protein [Oscillospiraceae bacterium]
MAKRPNTNDNQSPFADRKQWLFMALFVVIAAVSVWAVMSQDFSPAEFGAYVKGASFPWLIMALVSMLGFILFEALALLVLCRAFGYRPRLWNGYIYSASDIYFSAITPSATGGQPASAYFMMKDGMSGMTVTATLIANLCMYTLSIIVIGLICLFGRFDIFLQYSLPSQVLIAVGFLMQVGLLLFFYMVLRREKLLHRMCSAVLRLLCRMRLLRRQEEKQQKLDAYMERYREDARAISGHTGAMVLCFLFNLLQRASQIAVTMFVYAATAGVSLWQAAELWFWQGYVVLGSNCIPIPGGMGVSDYLMLDGFRNMMTENQAVNLELLSRSFSFYSCVIICGISVFIQYCVVKKRGRLK